MTSQVNDFTAFLCKGRCKSCGFTGVISYASLLSRASILFSLNWILLRAHPWGEEGAAATVACGLAVSNIHSFFFSFILTEKAGTTFCVHRQYEKRMVKWSGTPIYWTVTESLKIQPVEWTEWTSCMHACHPPTPHLSRGFCCCLGMKVS